MPPLPLPLLLLAAALPPQTPEWCKSLPRPVYETLDRVDVGSSWFEVYEVAGVYALYEPHQVEEVISYLILGSRRALLLDTGMGIGDITGPVARLTELPVTVLNTHTHYDHVGDNWRFDSVLGMDTAFTRANAGGGSPADAREAIAPGALCGELPEGFDRDGYAIRGFRITEVVDDGSKIDLGGRTLEVLATPGHTPDSICLLDRRNGLLFTGDLFYLGPIFLYRPETDLAAYRRSVERLRPLVPELRLLLPAHNTPVAAPPYLEKLDAALRSIEAGEAKPRDGASGYLDYPFDGFSIRLAPPG